MQTSKELMVIEGQVMSTLDQEPRIVLEEARRAADALTDVLDKKKKKVILNGEQYLEFEDWGLLGRFYGITAKEDGDVEYVQIGAFHGYRASAVALNRDHDVISRATAFCLTDEEHWKERPVYEWGYICKDGSFSVADPDKAQIIWEPNPDKPGKSRPKKERRFTGMAPVPLFQLASMAQTRAGAKVLRNVLSWVVVLAGYRPTPAEEIEGLIEQEKEASPKTRVVDPDTGEIESTREAAPPPQKGTATNATRLSLSQALQSHKLSLLSTTIKEKTLEWGFPPQSNLWTEAQANRLIDWLNDSAREINTAPPTAGELVEHNNQDEMEI